MPAHIGNSAYCSCWRISASYFTGVPLGEETWCLGVDVGGAGQGGTPFPAGGGAGQDENPLAADCTIDINSPTAGGTGGNADTPGGTGTGTSTGSLTLNGGGGGAAGTSTGQGAAGNGGTGTGTATDSCGGTVKSEPGGLAGSAASGGLVGTGAAAVQGDAEGGGAGGGGYPYGGGSGGAGPEETNPKGGAQGGAGGGGGGSYTGGTGVNNGNVSDTGNSGNINSGNGEAVFTYTPLATPTVTTVSAPASAATGTPYSAQFTITGNPAPAVTLGARAPSWLSVSSAGLVTGTPRAGTKSFTYDVIAANSLGTVDGATIKVAVSNRADVRATVACPASLAPGSAGTCTLTVTNAGPALAAGTVAGALVTGPLRVNGCSGGCSRLVGLLGWKLGSLPAGQSVTLSISVTAVRVGIAVVAVTGGSASPDPNLRNDVAAATLKVSLTR